MIPNLVLPSWIFFLYQFYPYFHFCVSISHDLLFLIMLGFKFKWTILSTLLLVNFLNLNWLLPILCLCVIFLSFQCILSYAHWFFFFFYNKCSLFPNILGLFESLLNLTTIVLFRFQFLDKIALFHIIRIMNYFSTTALLIPMGLWFSISFKNARNSKGGYSLEYFGDAQ